MCVAVQEYEEAPCFICGQTGHRQWECPNRANEVYKLPEAMQGAVDEQYQRDIARVHVRCVLCVPTLKRNSSCASNS